MPLWLQHVVVVLLLALALGFVGWQVVRTLWGKPGRLGSCCARGCGHADSGQRLTPSPKQGSQGSRRMVFLPAERLGLRPRHADRKASP